MQLAADRSLQPPARPASLLAACRHGEIVRLASFYGLLSVTVARKREPGKPAHADLLPEPAELWHREIRALRAITDLGMPARTASSSPTASRTLGPHSVPPHRQFRRRRNCDHGPAHATRGAVIGPARSYLHAALHHTSYNCRASINSLVRIQTLSKPRCPKSANRISSFLSNLPTIRSCDKYPRPYPVSGKQTGVRIA